MFVCIWIPDFLRKRIVKFQEEMKKLVMKAKFIEPENLHLTVTFLGEVEEREINSLKEMLDNSVKNIVKFNIKLEGLKIIPNENYIRVIGINAKNGDNISNLIKNVANVIDGKFYEEMKLTLCRVKNIIDKQALRNFIEKYRNVEIGILNVKSISIVKSILTRRGPVYKTVYESVLRDF